MKVLQEKSKSQGVVVNLKDKKNGGIPLLIVINNYIFIPQLK